MPILGRTSWEPPQTGWLRDLIGGVLLTPFRARPAHVVEFGPVRVQQGGLQPAPSACDRFKPARRARQRGRATEEFTMLGVEALTVAGAMKNPLPVTRLRKLESFFPQCQRASEMRNVSFLTRAALATAVPAAANSTQRIRMTRASPGQGRGSVHLPRRGLLQ